MSTIPTPTPDPREEIFSSDPPGEACDTPEATKGEGQRRWRTAVLLGLVYLVGVGVFLRLLLPLFPSIGGALWVLYHFPVGLFGAIAPRMVMQASVRGTLGPVLPLLGHAVYVSVYVCSIVFKNRWLAWLFVALVVINVRGCVAMALQ